MEPQQTVERPNRVQLPLDVILMIIEELVPEEPTEILPASHDVTKSLVAYETGHYDVKRHWFDELPESQRDSREFCLVLVDGADYHDRHDLSIFHRSWQQIDPGNRFQIKDFTVHGPRTEAYKGHGWTWPVFPSNICLGWLKERAIGGTLWDTVLKYNEDWPDHDNYGPDRW